VNSESDDSFTRGSKWALKEERERGGLEINNKIAEKRRKDLQVSVCVLKGVLMLTTQGKKEYNGVRRGGSPMNLGRGRCLESKVGSICSKSGFDEKN